MTFLFYANGIIHLEDIALIEPVKKDTCNVTFKTSGVTKRLNIGHIELGRELYAAMKKRASYN